jgi:VCBS repeat-containing protein
MRPVGPPPAAAAGRRLDMATYTISATDQTEFSARDYYGTVTPHMTFSTSGFLGTLSQTTTDPSPTGQANSYFYYIYNAALLFNLSGVAGSIKSITLTIPTYTYTSPDASERIVVYDVTTPTSSLTPPAGSIPADLSIYNDLQSGVVYGQGNAAPAGPPAPSGVVTGVPVTITLNAAAIAAAMADPANFNLGLDLADLNHYGEFTGGASSSLVREVLLLSQTAYLTIVTNSGPAAVADSYGVDEDAALVVAAAGVLGNDSDPDADSLTAQLVSDVSNGTLVLNADGSFTYTPDADFNGQDSFSYRASDGELSTDPVTVTITVGAVNDAPAANPDTGSAGENESASFAVLANDTDADGDTLSLASLGSVTVTSANGAINGIDASSAFSIVGGEIAFAPGAMFNALAVGDTATVVVGYTAQDPSGASAASTLTLTVGGANDGPVLVSGGAGDAAHYLLRVNNKVVTDVHATDVDGDTVTYSILNGGDGALFTIDATTGLLSFKDLPAIPNRSYNLTVQASDGEGGVDTQSITVGVTANQMVGTDQSDVFVFHSGMGANTVTGFDPDEDILQFDSGMFASDSLAGVLASAHETRFGDVVIDVNAGQIRLMGVTLIELQSADAVFI